ncbi:tyrosine-protein kinase hopscotch [Periplaneta americana]|uniref:tyrosine-protein kinase hopscotch n=1 Tax=Periplaneta americana TaxID=6978 RepID=UPI0037E86B8B
MGENVKYAPVHVYVDSGILRITLQTSTTAEDVCIEVSKQLGIGPVARHLFALRLHGSRIWFNPGLRLSEARTNSEYDFRLRYKVPSLSRLRKVDIKAYDYYFHQARNDVMINEIPDISYDKYKQELVGLGVADMYRVMLEKGVERDIVESDYKKYIPKEVLKHHFFFIKKPIHDSLGKIKKNAQHDAWYVKSEYLKQFEEMAPNYLSEEFKALTDEDGCVQTVLVKVNPFHEEQPGIRIRYDGKKEWHQLCTIDELCYISVRNDGTVEISRKNGIPSYLKFHSIPLMFSFVSLLDGYYRLMVKWTFNLCKDVPTPSLQKLYALKCHGPVGGEFSYAKLEEKRNNAPGCFILRQSESKYEVFYLDVCTKESSKPRSYKIEKLGEEEFLFSGDGKAYSSITQLVAAYRSGKDSIFLQECLPPSEYDKSNLLLCQLECRKTDHLSEGSAVTWLETASPQCINVRNLQVYKNQKKEGKGGMSLVYRSVWKPTKGKKVEAAMKILKQECRDKYLKEFLELAGRWAALQSNAVVKLYGVTLSSPLAMVMEYLSLGPLDAYLRQHKQSLKQVDLVEAGAFLAKALWHLEDQGVIHGNIRCRKLLVAAHDDNTFLVRLADPGLHSFNSSDIHWVPTECYPNFDFARGSIAADVWAFGTTMWEIFSYGECPPESTSISSMKKYYQSGKKLPLPSGCPVDIYRLMLECWDLDPYRRKKPQAIMRDINQILYQVFNSRRVHSYATAFSRVFRGLGNSTENSVTDSNASMFSGVTEDTYVDYSKSVDEEPITGVDMSSGFSVGSSLEGAWLLGDSSVQTRADDVMSPDFSVVLSNFNFSTATTTIDSVTSMQGIFELDADCNVILQGRIGQGFYGEVYKGTLEQDKDMEPQLVAIKKLKTNAVETSLQDFEREITIMKALKHPNIVEIKGVIQDPEISLVMEFVQHGSLQSYLKIHKDTLQEHTLLKFALDVAKGMEYLGRKNIVHRDLATRNILVANEHHVKISDFGLAQVMGKNDYYILKTSRELPIKWYAPESLRDGKFSPRSDVWSYGVTLYEMFSLGEDPRLPDCLNDQDQQQLLAALESGTRLPCPPQCSQTIYVRLMSPCWQADTHARPTFTQLCQEIQELG